MMLHPSRAQNRAVFGGESDVFFVHIHETRALTIFSRSRTSHHMVVWVADPHRKKRTSAKFDPHPVGGLFQDLTNHPGITSSRITLRKGRGIRPSPQQDLVSNLGMGHQRLYAQGGAGSPTSLFLGMGPLPWAQRRSSSMVNALLIPRQTLRGLGFFQFDFGDTNFSDLPTCLCYTLESLVLRLGFEPRLTESKSVVLPLDDLRVTSWGRDSNPSSHGIRTRHHTFRPPQSGARASGVFFLGSSSLARAQRNCQGTSP